MFSILDDEQKMEVNSLGYVVFQSEGSSNLFPSPVSYDLPPAKTLTISSGSYLQFLSHVSYGNSEDLHEVSKSECSEDLHVHDSSLGIEVSGSENFLFSRDSSDLYSHDSRLGTEASQSGSSNEHSDTGFEENSLSYINTVHISSVGKEKPFLLETEQTQEDEKVDLEFIDTPLHLAMRNNYNEQIRELLNSHADLTAVNGEGQTPLEVVDKDKITSVVKVTEAFFLEKLSTITLSIEKITMCHNVNNVQSLHLLVFLNSDKHESLPENYYRNGVHIQFKHRKNVSEEARIVAQMEDFHSNYKNLPPILNGEKADKLFREHSNLNIIATSTQKSVGFRYNYNVFHQPCYVLFCHCKSLIPYGESLFPESIDGIPTDVREGYFTFGSNQQIQIGTSILRRDVPKAGTIGGFVDLENGKTGLITCAHCFYSLEELRNRNLPTNLPVSTAFEEEDFGEVTRATFTPDDPSRVSVDAALVELHDGNTAVGMFPEISNNHLQGAGKRNIIIECLYYNVQW